MRICLSPGVLGDGGIGIHTLVLAREFAGRGLDTDLFLTEVTGPRVALVPEGVAIHEGGGRASTSLPHLVRYLKRNRPALLLSSTHHIHVLNILAHRLARSAAELVCIQHTHDSIALRHKTIRRRVYAGMSEMIIRRADVLVGVSGGVASDMESRLGLPPGRVRAIYNPAWNDAMAAQAASDVKHPWLGADRGHRTIIGVGRLTRQKDFPTLLRAFKRVRGRAEDVKLVILGDGEDRSALEELTRELGIAGHVDMPGHVVDPVAHMARADLFVLSSAWEGFGNVIVEALGAGTPVVSTDCPSGPAEILGDGRYGRLVPVGDPAALALAILIALAEPPERDVLRGRANEFAVARIADQYLALAS